MSEAAEVRERFWELFREAADDPDYYTEARRRVYQEVGLRSWPLTAEERSEIESAHKLVNGCCICGAGAVRGGWDEGSFKDHLRRVHHSLRQRGAYEYLEFSMSNSRKTAYFERFTPKELKWRVE